MKHLIIVIISLLISTYSVFSQRKSMNGFTLPLDDTIKVMLVFAEMDHTPCGNSNSPSNLWHVGSVPSDADDYFDANSNVAGYPSGYITKYMHEASFGQYNVLGDYYENVVTVPCNAVTGWGTGFIIDSLDRAYNNGNLIFANGSSLNEFDQWGGLEKSNKGLSKSNQGNNKIDVLIIIWRDNPRGCLNGQGLHPRETSKSFAGFSGFDNNAAFGGCASGEGV